MRYSVSVFVLLCLVLLARGDDPLPIPTPPTPVEAPLPAPPVGTPLPAPTLVPEAPPITGPFRRSPADDAAELPHTRDTNTYIYIVNGFDPCLWASLYKFADRIRVSGYPNTKYGEWYDMPAFEKDVRKVHAENPHARIVLIGYSAGCYTVLTSAHRLLRDGVSLAMIGYIGGDFLTDTPYNRPPQVGQVVNIAGNGFLLSGQNLVWNGTKLTNAINLRLRVKHFDLPMHPETFRTIYQALLTIPVTP